MTSFGDVMYTFVVFRHKTQWRFAVTWISILNAWQLVVCSQAGWCRCSCHGVRQPSCGNHTTVWWKDMASLRQEKQKVCNRSSTNWLVLLRQNDFYKHRKCALRILIMFSGQFGIKMFQWPAIQVLHLLLPALLMLITMKIRSLQICKCFSRLFSQVFAQDCPARNK